MNYSYLILVLAVWILCGSEISSGEDFPYDNFIRRTIVNVEEETTLFSEANAFYSMFGIIDEKCVKDLSNKLYGFKGVYPSCWRFCRYSVDGKPNCFLISEYQGELVHEKGYLICVIYPYSKNPKPTIETSENNWIQGERRFDFWIKDHDGKWKVNIDVDIKKPEEFFDIKKHQRRLCSTDNFELALERLTHDMANEVHLKKKREKLIEETLKKEGL